MLRYLPALIAAVCSASIAHAQDTQVTVPSPLQRGGLAVMTPQVASAVSTLVSDPAAWKLIHGAESVRMLDLPLGPARTVTVQLQRVDPFAPDAVIVEMVDGPNGEVIERPLPRPDADYFTGFVEGDQSSRVMLSYSVAGVHGYVQDDNGLYIISSGPPLGARQIVSYKVADLPDGTINWSQLGCEVRGGEQVFLQDEGGVAANPCRQVKIALDSDFEFSGLFGSDTAQSAAYAGTIFAGVLDIYKRDLNVLPQVVYLRLWATNTDPWTAGNSGTQLDEFRSHWLANMTGITRHTAHYLSGRGLGGGVAYLSSLCNSQAYGVEGDLGGYFPYPIQDNHWQNWDLMVVAHEIGHNFGAPHTHNYCPPVDKCAPSDYFGQCQNEQICISNGTIMSYCHLCGGGLGNMLMKFHDQNISSMSNYMGGGAPCNLLGTSVPPVGVYDYMTVPRGMEIDLDVMSNELNINCETVHIGNFSPTGSEGGTVSKLMGAGPGGRDVLRYLSPPGFTGQDVIWYRLIDASSQQSSLIFVYLNIVVHRYPDHPIGDSAALGVDYYELSNPTVLPDFGSLTPYLTTTASNINYPSTSGDFADSNRSDDVGARWTGWVEVTQTGLHTFSVTSDDGSKLSIGNVPVVSNDGLHAMEERTGGMYLLPGKHAITVEFFEAGGGAGCVVQVKAPGGTFAPIGAGSFTHGGVSNPFDMNHDGGVDGADLGMLLAVFNTSHAFADFNHDGQVDGADLGALLGAWGQ